MSFIVGLAVGQAMADDANDTYCENHHIHYEVKHITVEHVTTDLIMSSATLCIFGIVITSLIAYVLGRYHR
jgi:hypothetical protein